MILVPHSSHNIIIINFCRQYIIHFSIVTPDQWQSFSAHNVARAESEIQTSMRLREAMNQTILQSTSTLEALRIATNYAFRKRIHEVDQAKQELEWQLKNVRLYP